MSLGTRIKELRIKNNLSLQDVADKTGISKAHVWDMEKGNSGNPSVELVTKLADLFKVSVAYMVGEDPSVSGEKPELIALYRDLKKLEPQTLEAIQGFVDKLKTTEKK